MNIIPQQFTENQNSPLVVLERSLLERIAQACDRAGQVARKAVIFCAAKLLKYYRRWQDWKLRHHRTEWIYQPLKQIHADLMGEHSLHVIRAANDLLIELGFLERRHNPGNAQDRTYQYRVVEPERGEFRSESPKFNTEKSDTDSISGSDPCFVTEDSNPTEPEKTEERSQPLHTQAVSAIKAAGLPFNRQLDRLLKWAIARWGSASLAKIQQALSVVKSSRSENPPGLFTQALKLGWVPRMEGAQPPTTNAAPVGFGAWFDAAKAAGQAIASLRDDEGQIWIIRPDGTQVLYSEVNNAS